MKIRILSAFAALVIAALSLSSCFVFYTSGEPEDIFISEMPEKAPEYPDESDTDEILPAVSESGDGEERESESISADTEPTETEPTLESSPAETEPAQTTVPETEPAETKPAETEPKQTEEIETEPKETESGETTPPAPDESWRELVFTTEYPSVTASSLKVRDGLSIDEMKQKIRECEVIFYTNKQSNAARLKKALYEAKGIVDNLYMQYKIARLVYVSDLSVKDAEEDYYHTYELYLEANALLDDLVRFRYKIDYVLCEVVDEFHETEYSDVLYAKSGTDPSGARAKMTEAQNKYMTYNHKGTANEVIGLYTQYISASKSYADAFGYDNYYEYAAERTYGRDFGRAEREIFRKYVAEQLIPFYIDTYDAAQEAEKSIDSADKSESTALRTSRYDSLSENYLMAYFDYLPDAVGEKMKTAITMDRIVVGEAKNASNTSYQTVVGDTPMCYFHRSSLVLPTMSHEIGHYYAAFVRGDLNVSQDIIEVHSQSSMVLMISFMNSEYGSVSVRDFCDWQLLNIIYQTIAATIRDEFEEIVLSAPDSDRYTVSDMNGVMEELIKKYRVDEFSPQMAGQLRSYWYTYSLSNPGYRLSYAVSSMAALQIYRMSLYDYDAAVECYRKTVEEIDPESTFLGTLKNAGLLSPFDEECFKEIRKISLF